MEVAFFVPGVPVGKGRPRVTKLGVAYTPAKTRAWEKAVAWEAIAAMGGRAPMEGPLALEAEFQFEVPRSWTKRRKAEAHWKVSAPDTDNLLKAATDGCNGVVFADDSQLVDVRAVKLYGRTAPGVHVRVREAQA